MQNERQKHAKSTWPLASYQPVERRTTPTERRKEDRGDDRRRPLPRVLRSLLRL